MLLLGQLWMTARQDGCSWMSGAHIEREARAKAITFEKRARRHKIHTERAGKPVTRHPAYQKISDLRGGDHVCHFHDGDEESLGLLASFIRTGLEERQKTIIVAESRRLSDIASKLADLVGDGRDEPHSPVVLMTLEELPDQAGGLTTTAVAAFLREKASQVSASGFTALRIWACIEVAPHSPPGEAIIRYETILSGSLTSPDVLLVCCYRMQEVDSGLAFDILRAHPKVMVNGLVYPNCFYRASSGLGQDQGPTARLRHLLESIAQRSRADRRAASHLDLEKALAEVSRRLLIDGHEALDASLEILGRAVEADRSYIFLFRNGLERMDNVFEWCASGVEPQKERLQDMPSSDFPWWMDKLQRGDNIIIRDVSTMNQSTQKGERAVLEMQNIKAVLVVPINSEDNRLIGFMGFDDICSRRTWGAEDARLLRLASDIVAAHMGRARSEARFRAIAEAAPEMIFTLTPEGVITYINPAFEAVTGLARGEWTGRSFYDLPLRGEKEEILSGLRQSMDGRSGAAAINTILTSSGEARIIETSFARLEYGDRLHGLAAISRDITERKRIEEHLLHTQKMEALGRVVGGVAHDFNNILAAISGYSEVALSRLAPGHPAAKDVGSVKDIALHAGLLTRRLHTFSRRSPLARERVNLNDIISRLSIMLKPVVGSSVDLVIHLAEDLPDIMAEPGALEQVLVNLAINSRDAISRSGTLNIETASAPSGVAELPHRSGLHHSPCVRLTVTDTGIGMDPETKRAAFEPFFTTKELGESTGLGLSIVHAIVKQTGGEIFIESAPGAGTTCTIYLPACEDDRSASTDRQQPGGAQPHAGSSAPEAVASALRHPPEAISKHQPAARLAQDATEREQQSGATILIIDDNQTLRRFSVELLERHSYRVLTAANAQEALDVLGSTGGTVDLVITDVKTSQHGAHSLAESIAQTSPHTRILFTSAFADGPACDLEDRRIEILQKPFPVDTLLARIADLLSS